MKYSFHFPQSTNQGTVSPTHYNIIYDFSGWSLDRHQLLAYKLCHLYYNWAGAIRVPGWYLSDMSASDFSLLFVVVGKKRTKDSVLYLFLGLLSLHGNGDFSILFLSVSHFCSSLPIRAQTGFHGESEPSQGTVGPARFQRQALVFVARSFSSWTGSER